MFNRGIPLGTQPVPEMIQLVAVWQESERMSTQLKQKSEKNSDFSADPAGRPLPPLVSLKICLEFSLSKAPFLLMPHHANSPASVSGLSAGPRARDCSRSSTPFCGV